MKRLIAAIAFGVFIVPAAFAREQTVLARVTVYWRSEGQFRASWNGARLRDGHCAVDPQRIPFGSKVIFADTTCVAVDSGPAVINRKAARLTGHTAAQRNAIVVDRFFENRRDALAWESTHPYFMTLRVVAPGSEKENKDTRQRGTMLAQANARSTIPPGNLPPIPASSGLQTRDASLAALLLFTPLLRVARRRS
jgi:3D (Asp-Asp-Asp) domain-containing protein